MKRIRVMFLLSLVTIMALTGISKAGSGSIECEGDTSKVKAVTVPGYQERLTIFNNLTVPQGQLDPDPIVRTRIFVSKDSCLTAHFSTIARPTDNWLAFQVRITGNGFFKEPLDGHTIGLDGTLTPVFYTVEETDKNAPRLVSRTLSKRVPPGVYEIEVVMAGGNNVIIGDEPGVYDPTLVLYYN